MIAQYSKSTVELLSAKHSHVDVSRLDSCVKGSTGSNWIGPIFLSNTGTIFVFNSILKSSIWAAKLYRRGEGLSPCACPFCRSNVSEKVPASRAIRALSYSCLLMPRAVLFVPIDVARCPIRAYWCQPVFYSFSKAEKRVNFIHIRMFDRIEL